MALYHDVLHVIQILLDVDADKIIWEIVGGAIFYQPICFYFESLVSSGASLAFGGITSYSKPAG